MWHSSTLTFDGVPAEINNLSFASVLASPTIVATNGADVTVNSLLGLDVLSNPHFEIDGTSALELGSGINLAVGSSTAIDFTGDGSGTLRLAPGLDVDLLANTTVTGFGAGDTIDYGGTTTGFSYDESTGNLSFLSGGIPVATVHLEGDYSASDFAFDSADGSISFVCFLAGTKIATPTGPVAIETLRAGDLVLTAEGKSAPVRWLARQTVSMRFADPLRALPVRIQAGALGDNLPEKDLFVSPEHALLLDGVLVQAGALVNGTTIQRHDAVGDSFVYYHVELADHALILAEGVAAETFVDNVTRRNFDNWQEHPAASAETGMLSELDYPRVKAHRQMPRALQARLAARAAAAFGETAAKVA